VKPAITGLGMVTPFGSGRKVFWEGLQGNREAQYEREKIITAQGEKELGFYSAKIQGLDAYLPARARRRMEPFTQMGVLSCCLALEDAGIDSWENKRIGIVFGSAYGNSSATFTFQDSIIDYGDGCPSPTHFVNSVHNALASHVSIALKIKGPCTSVTCFEMTTALVMHTARDFLAMDMADLVIAGIGEENSQIRKYATASLTAGNIDSLVEPAEAFTCFILEKEEKKMSYGYLCDIRFGRGIRKNEGLLDKLSAVITSGRSIESKNACRPPLYDYSSKYGYMPSGDSLALAAAALSIKHGVLPCDSLVLAPGAVLGCSHHAGRFSSLITVER